MRRMNFRSSARHAVPLSIALFTAGLTAPAPAFARGEEAAHRHQAHRNASTPWWKKAVIYQIYPRSFADSNGDGVGDLNGIIGRLDYLQSLGVNVVWLSPHFDSPNVDNGYDIRDYRKVMAEFGTMRDFDRMVTGMRARGIKLVIDLVVNHTSDEHRWFEDAKQGPNARYRDYYIWRAPKANGTPPNNAASFFGGSAWSRAGKNGDYYLHYFAKQQPDLNWDNPKVRTDIYDIMKFWLNKGVAGFRMDVIPLISKDPAFPDLTPAQLADIAVPYAHGPRTHQYLREMNREVLRRYDAMTVGEAIGIKDDEDPLFTSPARQELNMIFHFDASNVDRDGWKTRAWTLPEWKARYDRLYTALGPRGWTATFLTNHDKPRAVSHFGDDSPEWRALSAKALATMSLLQRGTPFVYQGDELGMTNFPFTAIDQYRDISALNLWHDKVETGEAAASDVLAVLAKTSRDNARTPMQWDGTAAAGFTTGTPWIAVNPNYRTINAAQQAADTTSVLTYYKRLIRTRRSLPFLIDGSYRDIDPGHANVYAFTRVGTGGRAVVLINFSKKPVDYALPQGIRLRRRIINNGTGAAVAPGAARVVLAPWEASVYTF
ncbi:oligo-1,6-glucosidase [Sphingomonas sp. NFR04]|nr:oligo-1,6-glucosidase [Sphingomonas sp. NFR04]